MERVETAELLGFVKGFLEKAEELFEENELLKEKISQMSSLMDAQGQTIDSLEKEIAKREEALAFSRQRNKVLTEKEWNERDEHYFSSAS